MTDDIAYENTDRELWREIEADYYAPSIHVTEQGGIGINFGGTVYVKTLREWHALAGGPYQGGPMEPREDVEALHEAIGPPHGDRAKAAAHIELDALLARLEQTKRELADAPSVVHYTQMERRAEAAERALREIAEDRVPTTYGGGATAWRSRARAALASGEGEER